MSDDRKANRSGQKQKTTETSGLNKTANNAKAKLKNLQNKKSN